MLNWIHTLKVRRRGIVVGMTVGQPPLSPPLPLPPPPPPPPPSGAMVTTIPAMFGAVTDTSNDLLVKTYNTWLDTRWSRLIVTPGGSKCPTFPRVTPADTVRAPPMSSRLLLPLPLATWLLTLPHSLVTYAHAIAIAIAITITITITLACLLLSTRRRMCVFAPFRKSPPLPLSFPAHNQLQVWVIKFNGERYSPHVRMSVCLVYTHSSLFVCVCVCVWRAANTHPGMPCIEMTAHMKPPCSSFAAPIWICVVTMCFPSLPPCSGSWLVDAGGWWCVMYTHTHTQQEVAGSFSHEGVGSHSLRWGEPGGKVAGRVCTVLTMRVCVCVCVCVCALHHLPPSPLSEWDEDRLNEKMQMKKREKKKRALQGRGEMKCFLLHAAAVAAAVALARDAALFCVCVCVCVRAGD